MVPRGAFSFLSSVPRGLSNVRFVPIADSCTAAINAKLPVLGLIWFLLMHGHQWPNRLKRGLRAPSPNGAVR
jgi:hypothetical protein